MPEEHTFENPPHHSVPGLSALLGDWSTELFNSIPLRDKEDGHDWHYAFRGLLNSEWKQVRQQPSGINFSNEIDLILKRRLVSQVKLLARVREGLYLRFSLFNSGKITYIRRVLQTVLNLTDLMRSFCCSFLPTKRKYVLYSCLFLSSLLGPTANK